MIGLLLSHQQVCRWHKIVAYTPERHQLAEEMFCQEHHEVQQREMQSSVSGEEQADACRRPPICKNHWKKRTCESWWTLNCTLATKKDNGVPCNIRQSIARRSWTVMLHLYSALLGPHLEYCVHFRASQYNGDMNILEGFQCKVTKIVEGVCCFSYQQNLREL